MAVVVSIVSALIGAIAAGLLAQYLRRSRPVLIIDEISRSADLAPYSTGAVMNSDLVSACKENNEFISPETFSGTEERVTEKDYIAAIHSALGQTELAIEGLPAVTEVARSLSDYLLRDDFRDFQLMFSREFARLWPTLIGAYVRGKFFYRGPEPLPLRNGVLKPQAPLAEGEAPAAEKKNVVEAPSLLVFPGVRAEFSEIARSIEFSHPVWQESIVQDEDGDFLIPMKGPMNLLFPWRKNIGPAQTLRASAFAMRTAVSFAAWHKPDLQDISNFLLTVEQENLPLLESLQRRLKEELLEYERLVIKGFVANRGGSPVTVTNSGRLFVNLAGYSFTDEERSLKILAGDQQVDVIIGADREDGGPAFGSSITVDAGGVTRFVATSKLRIEDLPDSEVVLKALTGGERLCYLGTMIVSQGNRLGGQRRSKSQFSATYTAPQPFRDSASEVEVPSRHGVFARDGSGKSR